MKRPLLLIAFLLVPLWASVAPPVLNDIDLDSGPNTGNGDISLGQTANQDGTIVTIVGNNLGLSQGSSTIQIGGAPARVYFWQAATSPCMPANLANPYQGKQCIVAQVSHLATNNGTGADAGKALVQVTVGGVTSNALDFTIRSGNIYFAKGTGSNSNNGAYATPWLNLWKCKQSMSPGDICYGMSGSDNIDRTSGDCTTGIGVELQIAIDGTAGNPIGLVGYPGYSPHVGYDVGNTGCGDIDFYNASKCPGTNACVCTDPAASFLTGWCEVHYWTISKLTFVGATNNSQARAVHVTGNDRFAFNLFTEPDDPCNKNDGFLFITGDQWVMTANETRNLCQNTSTSASLYHTWYISTYRTNLSGFDGCGYPGPIPCDGVTAAPGGKVYADIQGTSHIIRYNYFDGNNSQTAIQVYGHQDNHQCDSSGTSSGGGCSYAFTGFFIDNNVCVNQAGNCVKLGSGVVGDNYIRNNIFVHAGISLNDIVDFTCVRLGGSDGAAPGATTYHIIGNTLSNCGDTSGTTSSSTTAKGAFYMATSNSMPTNAYSLEMKDNLIANYTGYTYFATIAACGSGACPINPSTNPSMLANNLWFGGGTVTGCQGACLNPSTWETNGQFTDPRLASTDGSDVHLTASSVAAIGKGIYVSAIDPDIAGTARGNPSDIGAYQYAAAALNGIGFVFGWIF